MIHVCFHPTGLASVTMGPTNQTTCFGASSSFDCVISGIVPINWFINNQRPGMVGVDNPATIALSTGAGVKSTLILPGSLLFSGASVVCSDGQIYSVPAFLTIQGTLKTQLQMY